MEANRARSNEEYVRSAARHPEVAPARVHLYPHDGDRDRRRGQPLRLHPYDLRRPRGRTPVAVRHADPPAAKAADAKDATIIAERGLRVPG
jgi:hypothetical protein